MALNIAELTLVLEEITPVLRGGWIQAVHQPGPRTLVFEIRMPGRTHRLLVCCEPSTARLHLITHKLPNPPSPPAFCRYLRAHLHGARIETIRQVPQDRVAEIALTTKDGPRTLICALTGKRATVLVLDRDRKVLAALQPRNEIVGQSFRAPASRKPEGHESAGTRFSAQPDGGPLPISSAVERHYRREEARFLADETSHARLRDLNAAIKKERRRIEAWQGDLTKARRYRDYARYGELLKANLGSSMKGIDRITLVDYFDDAMPEVTIPLDADKSARGNMDEYFRKHRKYLAAERELKPRIEQAEREVTRLQSESAAIRQGAWTPPVASPTTAAFAQQAVTRTNKKSDAQRRGPFRRFTSSDGLPIFVGRNARENDELTFGFAKSEDLWLHARGTPGSHVVVRVAKGKEPPPDTLRDAATLALLYSDLRKSGKGEVIYTRRKWVKKAKGQAPGAVLVTQERSLHITLDRSRLTALKERTTDGGASLRM